MPERRRKPPAFNLSRKRLFGDSNSGLLISKKLYSSSDDIKHEHEFFELVVVLSGRGVHVAENGEREIARGDVFLIKPGFQHSYRDLEALEIANILYLPERLSIPLADLRDVVGYLSLFDASSGLSDEFRRDFVLRLDAAAMTDAEGLIVEMEREREERKKGWRFAMSALFMRLILLLSRAADDPALNADPRLSKLAPVLSFIEERCHEGIRVSDLAAASGMSTRTLERFFLDALGVGPGRYLASFRLEKAARLLVQTSLPVSEVAARAGFPDRSYFSLSFRREFGCPPGEYRQARRED